MGKLKTTVYTKKALEGFMQHLSELGLSVYGPCMKDEVEYPSFMDYDVDDIINRRKCIQDGSLFHVDDITLIDPEDINE